jgi:antirestriction protein ArdC
MEAKQLNSKAMQRFAELMIEKIEQVDSDWSRPWITLPAGLPRNAVTNRPYNGLNDLMLFFHTERKGYAVPAYLTYNQASKAGAHVLQGERGFPVAFWGKVYVNREDSGKRLKPSEFEKLSDMEKEHYKEKLFLQEYTVFNVQQTSIPENKPEMWEKIRQNFMVQRYRDENGMFKSADIDSMLENQSWLCPVNVKEGNRAFYRPLTDEITVPLKAQFQDGESFYTTLLHEMAHSTGSRERLDREQGGYFGDAKYAKEELVAELTAALTAGELGISSTIREENAQYLKSWLDALKAEPRFILTVLSDVHKAANMIDKVVRKEELAAAEKEAKTVKDTKGEGLTDSKPAIKTATGGKLFTKDEIPINELERLGLKLSDLSATDLNNLMKGKKTKAFYVNQRGERTSAVLSLHRNTDNSVNIVINPAKQKQKIKLKM